MPESIPAPPPEYRGTSFEWRLRHPITSAELVTHLEQVSNLGSRDRTALLLLVGERGDPAFAPVLLDLQETIPDSPQALACFSTALIGTLRGMRHYYRRDPRAQDEGPRVSVMETLLFEAVLSNEVRKVREWKAEMNRQSWGGVLSRVRQVRELVPELWSQERSDMEVENLRSIVEGVLETSAEPVPGYRGGSDVFRLASYLADDGTRGLFVEVLREWDTVRVKFPTTPTRPDLLAKHLAMQSIIDSGNESQRVALADLLLSSIVDEDDDRTRRSLIRHARRLADHAGTDTRTKSLLSARLTELAGSEPASTEER